MGNISSFPELPGRIRRLGELASNFWWSWHPSARELFRILDYPLWKITEHNPVKLLREIGADALQRAVDSPEFLRLYDSVIWAFDADLQKTAGPFALNPAITPENPVAYFSMEFGLHNSLPIYAGGLGILAGDICKEASDLGMPIVAVGLLYPEGYFRQHISPEGCQQEIYLRLNVGETAAQPVFSREGGRRLATVPLGNRLVFIEAWQVFAGRTVIYLLDTNLEENRPEDRGLCNNLYPSDRETRLRQEILLGIGGVRVLRGLGIKPSLWHLNEGHTTFVVFERIKEEIAGGMSFQEASQSVRNRTVFTTHTPVPAAHEAFPVPTLEQHLQDYWNEPAVDRVEFLRLGQQNGTTDPTFNMTVLGLRMAEHRNGVSRLHGSVAREMWRELWKAPSKDDVPICHVTNGVHLPTWIAPEVHELYEKWLGSDWMENQDDPNLWERILDVPDEELWAVHQLLKRKLLAIIRDYAQESWAEGQAMAEQLVPMGVLLDPGVLSIGFVRRFTNYKRPELIFHDIERLKRIITDPWRPVQLIFAGKCHPADLESKRPLQQIYLTAKSPEFRGRIAFVENYDMHRAHYLVQGVDVWLNTPRRLQEACGTSGMKCAVNGIPHLSVLDGWWYEAYNGKNGWKIGDGPEGAQRDREDAEDAEALYRLLEEELVPLYYDQSPHGIPRRWIAIVKEAIRSLAPAFSARRMLKDYIRQIYCDVLRPSDRS